MRMNRTNGETYQTCLIEAFLSYTQPPQVGYKLGYADT